MIKSGLFSMFLSLLLINAKAQSPIKWEMGMNISTNGYGNMHPRMSVDGAGNPMVIWGRMSDQSVFLTRWNGTAFSTPVKLNPSWMTIASASWMGPDIASKGDTVYVVAKRTPETSDTNRIYIFSSYNGGASFNPPVQLAFIADSASRFPTVTVDLQGNPIVAFMKFNASLQESRWVVAISNDFGKTFSTDVKASGYSGAKAEVCDCCPGAIVSSSNRSAMLYRDDLSNIRDIWTGISNNNGVSFNSGFAIDNNKWMVMSCPASGPDGVIIGDSIYTTFMSRGTGNYRIYLSKTSIVDGSIGYVSALRETIPGLTIQDFPRIATDGKAIAVVWRQMVSGSAQLPIIFTNNITTGLPLSYDTVDMKDITNADVALNNGNVFIVWQDDISGTVKYRKGTYLSAVSLKPISSPIFSMFPNPFSTELDIKAENSGENFELKVINQMGQIIFSENFVNSLKINLKDLSAGLYFVQIISNKGTITRKIVKE